MRRTKRLKTNEDNQNNARHAHDYINTLNDDCLILIFELLPICDRISIERVCKRWRILAKESWRYQKFIDFNIDSWGSYKFIDCNDLKKVAKRCGQYVKHLEVRPWQRISEIKNLQSVAKFLPNLEVLDLRDYNLSPKVLKSLLINCENIIQLSIRNIVKTFKDTDLSDALSICKKLQEFRFKNSNIKFSVEIFEALPCDTIQKIHLNKCTRISWNKLPEVFSKYKNLNSLSLTTCICNNGMSGWIINCLEKIPLEQLHLSKNDGIADSFLIELSNKCGTLKNISIMHSNKITDHGISALTQMPSLECVTMQALPLVTEKGISNICRQNKFEWFSISGTKKIIKK
ncbi:hypothetical protein TKK_0009777 [Trichogramma kaykai]|uniref:F-box domain-containing protein n=1 Tax=Trichogramma kaykai TaxID=54128 RepID=A0ABD2X0V1_9HYME